MMIKVQNLALVVVSLVPAVSLALGLGDIKLASTLNAPLDAQIELIGASPEELASLKASLASSETFARYGLERPNSLNTVTLTRGKSPDGRDVLQVHSTDSMTEPFITLLIEADWARGRLVREYTVLLDPPVFTPKSSAAPPVAIAGAESGATERSGAVARPSVPATAAETPDVPAAVTTPVPAEPRPTVSERPPAARPAPAVEAGTYTVQRGDSLSRIVGNVVGADRREARQAMVAIYRANPAAFERNMNQLHAGAVLRIPDATALAAVSPAEAASEVRDQYRDWRERPASAAPAAASGHLRLVTPGEAPSAAKSGAASGESDALRGQVHDLEGQLADAKRLLEVRSADLAALQAKLTAAQAAAAQSAAQGTAAAARAPAAAPPAAAPPAAPAAVASTPPAPVAEPAVPPAPPVTAPPVTADSGSAAPAPTAETAAPPAPAAVPPPAPKRHVTPAPAPVESDSLVDTLQSLWYVPVILILLVAGFFGFRRFRARRKAQFDDQLGRLAGEPSSGDMREIGTIDTSRLRRPMPSKDDESFLVEESGSHERPAFADMGSARAPVQNVRTDETMSSETAINLDQGDPLAEADFHMAYGLYDQAADLVRMAIAREPRRRDLKLKLLEVFFVWGNRDQFLAAAHELAQSRVQAAPGEWDKIVIMGKQIAPEDPLFSPTVGFSGAAASGVDLDLEGGQNRVDFDLLAEPGGEGGGPGADFGRTLGDRDPTGEAPGLSEEHIDFLLDDPGRGADASGSTTRELTAQMPQKESEVPTGSWAAPEMSEAPTVEQPAMRPGDNPTIREKVEHALRQNSPADQTAEVAIDDLGLDLGALDETDGGEGGSGAESPTMVAGLDPRTRKLMEDAEQRARGAPARSPEISKDPSESGTWFVDEADTGGADLGGSLDTASTAQIRGISMPADAAVHDSGATSQIAALKVDDLDLDFADLEPVSGAGRGNGAHRGNGTALDLDVGTVSVPVDATYVATQQVSPEDLALPDLEPVTMSEVGTKLDLARAYMDMGDPEGARNILHEVLSEGSVSQKQEAQRLIASLPG